MLRNRLSLPSRLALGLALFACLAAPKAQAQLVNGHQWPHPRLNYVSPAGGKVDTTFEVTFAGTELDQPEALLFSHPGIKATKIIPPEPKPDPKVKPDP